MGAKHIRNSSTIMKKIFTTIWIILQITFLVSTNIALAAEDEIQTDAEKAAIAEREKLSEFRKAFDTIIESPCIKDNVYSQNAADKVDLGYIVEILHEPLDFGLVTAGSTEDYQIRRCFDNTLQFRYKRKDSYTSFETLNFLAAEKDGKPGCSQNAQALSKEILPEMEVRYSCREVQVILSKGGPTGFYRYISMIWRFGMSLGGLVSVVVIIISGIQISASGGSQDAVKSGKTRIIKSLLGLAILILSGLILNTINPIFFTK